MVESNCNNNWLLIFRHLISNYQGGINVKKSRASFLCVFALGGLLVSQTLRRHLTPWFSILLLMGLAVKPVYGQGDWPSWGHDAGNQRHSLLTQINAENVSTLVPVWRYNMVKRGVASKRAQSTPLMVNGLLYLSFPYYRVVALQPETGEFIWEFTAPGDWNSEEHQKHWTGSSMRGLAYWPGEGAIPP